MYYLPHYNKSYLEPKLCNAATKGERINILFLVKYKLLDQNNNFNQKVWQCETYSTY